VCHEETLNEQAYNEVTLSTSDNIISLSYGQLFFSGGRTPN